jgi:hypothetical protein
MRFTRLDSAVSIGGKIQMLMVLFLVTFMISACAGVNIEATRALSMTGRNVALQTQQNIFVSDKEYLRARDSEALLHGFSGTTESENYTNILKLYDDIHRELAKRSVVFEKLADLYDAFGELAGLDAGEQTERALGNLGGAIEDYAEQIKQPSPIYSGTTAVISKIGGLVATEIQKAKIKEASIQIRARVEDIQKLLENELVREQMTGFQEFLLSDRKAAFVKLWDAEVYDPTPLLNDFGADVGLVAQKDVTTLIKTNKALKDALVEVLDKRLAIKSELIRQGYDASLGALRHLVTEHKKLEQGEPLDLTRLRAIVAELRGIAVLLAKAKTD